MYEFFNIGEIAEFFQIPASKLRYWDKEGLINLSRNINNDYREYSFKSVSDVATIAFYRSINIPIKELKTLSNKTIDDLAAIFDNTEEKIKNQIQELEVTLKRIETKKNALAKIKAYEQVPYKIEDFNFEAVVEFDRFNREHLHKGLNDSESFAIVVDPAQKEQFLSGIVYAQKPLGQKLLWQNTNKKCLKSLLKFYHGVPQENIQRSMSQLFEYLDKNNYKYGTVIARFLISEFGDNPVNYHEAYVELL